MKRSPLPPRKTWLKRSTKPIRSVNPVAKRKRDKRHAKDRRSPSVRAAIATALKRAGGQCEFDYGYSAVSAIRRCPETARLEPHHLGYPKTRPLAATDIKILCWSHHQRAESEKPHKWGKRFVRSAA